LVECVRRPVSVEDGGGGMEVTPVQQLEQPAAVRHGDVLVILGGHGF
jgi:hypothetical protein